MVPKKPQSIRSSLLNSSNGNKVSFTLVLASAISKLRRTNYSDDFWVYLADWIDSAYFLANIPLQDITVIKEIDVQLTSEVIKYYTVDRPMIAKLSGEETIPISVKLTENIIEKNSINRFEVHIIGLILMNYLFENPSACETFTPLWKKKLDKLCL